MSKKLGSHNPAQLLKEIQDLNERWSGAQNELLGAMAAVQTARNKVEAIESDMSEAVRLFTSKLPEGLRRKMSDWLASNGAERYSSPSGEPVNGTFEGADGADHHE